MNTLPNDKRKIRVKSALKKTTHLDLFKTIKGLIENARKAAQKSINVTMVSTYFEIGRIILEHEQKGKKRAEYAKKTLIKLSRQLTDEFGKGFSVDNLENMRKFYSVYGKSETLSRISTKRLTGVMSPGKAIESKTLKPVFRLSWSHYLKLMRIENEDERKFYEIESGKNNWGVRDLKRQFDSALYERLIMGKEKEKIKELSEKGQVLDKPEDAIKDPYILEFLGLEEESRFSETRLETAIINKLEDFLLELGKGFTFVARQKRISFDEKHFFIDLIFYNRLLKCFVLIDLKIGEISHQDPGQIQMYVNYYDRFVKTEDENKTIGIVLCKDKNETLVEITLPQDNDQIFASRYKLYLPSKEELKKQLEVIEYELQSR
jgi:predicted nuclease of restriction endonuclease-like (RecB) superfamily